MPPKKKTLSPRTSSADSSAAVDVFMAGLKHAHKPEIQALRKIISSANPSIAEGVKWNAPSFRTTEYFATTHLRAKEGVGLILHLGAKVRTNPSVRIDDPDGILHWLGKDRAMLTFKNMSEVRARKAALASIVRQWIEHI